MTAVVKDLLSWVEETAPRELAEPWDNVGLLVGDEAAPVHKVWVALEATEDLIEAAQKAGVDAIVTHHPLIFTPMKRITTQTATGRMVLALARAGISLISAHTNLDAADGGVNDCLAQRLALADVGELPSFPCGRTGLLPVPMSGEDVLAHVRGCLDP